MENRYSDAAQKLIGKKFKVLDDGFICLQDVMGSDEDIEQAARVSYGKGTRKVSDTNNLLRFLMRHHHSTPFEMAECKFYVRVPMDCWRQWIRHRTASVNEYSTRYSEAIDGKQKTENHEWRLQSKSNKQGSEEFLTDYPKEFMNFHLEKSVPSNTYKYTGGHTAGEYLSKEEKQFQEYADRVYQQRLEFGVAKEQARKDLPLSTYTEAYWKMDVKNLMHFMSLRCDSHAQLEIRLYANKIAGMVKELFPITFQAWYDYHFNAVNLTRLDRLLLNQILKDTNYTSGYDKLKETYLEQIEEDATEFGMSKREITEFWDKISPPTEQDFSL